MQINIQYDRDGLIEKESFGYVERYSNLVDYDYPYYLRSCAKPLQASLLIDYKIDDIFSLSSEEIALCCASHAGESIHTEIAKRLLTKFGLNESNLKCGIHEPLSRKAKENLLLNGDKANVFHNNCVGKHLLFLAICKINNWELSDYDSFEHPLEKIVKQKIYDLCEVKKEYPLTKDGCGVPILSMPLKNMLIGFINLFSSDKYTKIKHAFLDNPYIIGGENRLDTEIMIKCPGLIAKVGAGGLCIVVDLKKHDAFIVKINDTDMESRRFAVLNLINKFNFADVNFDSNIYTLHKEKVGKIKFKYTP